MNSPELISLQKYAANNRLSIHTVIKKTMNGELPTVVKDEDGKEITYIVLTDPKQPLPTPASSEDFVEIDYKKAYEDLNKEYLVLKRKYQKLVDMLEG